MVSIVWILLFSYFTTTGSISTGQSFRRFFKGGAFVVGFNEDETSQEILLHCCQMCLHAESQKQTVVCNGGRTKGSKEIMSHFQKFDKGQNHCFVGRQDGSSIGHTKSGWVVCVVFGIQECSGFVSHVLQSDGAITWSWQEAIGWKE